MSSGGMSGVVHKLGALFSACSTVSKRGLGFCSYGARLRDKSLGSRGSDGDLWDINVLQEGVWGIVLRRSQIN